ncbi:MAG: family 10 glycosylhydrolase [Nitrospinae bacterium]|nr:family 10 glycosylhydrolase [Nitrospinota bacterium]
MKRSLRNGALCLLLLALLVSGCSYFHENFLVRLFAPKPFEIGLWVQAEGANRTLDSAEKIKALVKRACAAGVTDIYAQVYRSGRAWFPTKLADDSPSRRAGRDPLALLLDLASRGEECERSIRVHAWINAFALARNKKAPIIRELGKEAVLKDQYGRSLLDYPLSGKPPWAKGFGLGTPGIFLDPGNPGVRGRITDVAAHLVRNYPRLAGVHLDFIRYPYALPISPGSRFSPRLDFGYNEASMNRFTKETEKTAPRAGASVKRADAAVWDAWRREQVTAAVRGVYETTKGIKRQVIVSAAVLPWAERAYLSAFQDWRGWLESGFLDKAVVMNYTGDERLAAQISRSAIAARKVKTPNPRTPEVVIGLGAYLFAKNPAGLWREWRSAREAGAAGVALFSYDQMVGNDAMWKFPGR